MKVRLYTSWRGHRYADVVEMPADDHTFVWLGLGLCELVDEDGLDEFRSESAMGVTDDGLLRVGEDDKPAQPGPVG